MSEDQKATETAKQGYIRLDLGFFARKSYQGYMYLDRENEYAGDQIFIDHHITVHFLKKRMVSPDGKYAFVFCKVRKEDAEIFEACLVQLHTILSKEEGYKESLDILTRTLEDETTKEGE